MNNSNLDKIKNRLTEAQLKKFNNSKGIIEIAEEAKEEDVLIYRLRDGEKSLQNLKARLEKSNAGLVFVFGKKFNSFSEKIVQFEENEYSDFYIKFLNHFYPLGNVKVIGITGTNGKTTTAFYANQILSLEGKLSAYIGTLGFYIGEKFIQESKNTTPGAASVRRFLFNNKDKIEFLCIELTSHALDQDRLLGLKLDAGGWTNFTRDHLDYHKTEENYLKAKLKIFDLLKPNCLLAVTSDAPIDKMQGYKDKFTIVNETNVVPKTTPFFLMYDFNWKNFELAEKSVDLVGVKFNRIKIAKILPSIGRVEYYQAKDRIVIIDYAHTPDAVERVLENIKRIHSSKKILTLIGCGGDRDSGKRPIMAKLAEKYSDKVILTSDNPRTENPMNILQDMLAGLENKKNAILCEDRKKAIEMAIKDITFSDFIVLVAGKGHENYQEINGIRYPFSDIELVKGYIDAI